MSVSESSPSSSSPHYIESDFPIIRQSGRILAGTLTTCTNTNTSSTSAGVTQAVVLLLHGLASHKDHNFAPVLARALSMNAGLNVLRFNFRSPPPSPLEPFHRFRICGADDDVDDVSAVLAALALRNMHVITLIGHSRGAAVALLSATRLPSLSQIEKVVLLAPRWEAAHMLDGPFFQHDIIAALESGEIKQFVWTTRAGEVTVTSDDIKTLRCAGTMEGPLAALANTVKILIIHGDSDRIIPLSSAYAFQNSRPEIVQDVIVISGASHNFETKSHADELVNAVIDFLAQK
jgi:pimeloyl-ACP methyl ester carboxylesterase